MWDCEILPSPAAQIVQPKSKEQVTDTRMIQQVNLQIPADCNCFSLSTNQYCLVGLQIHREPTDEEVCHKYFI